jgi:hypothetical protein
MLRVCTVLSCAHTLGCSDSVSLADRAVGRHHINMRDALMSLIKLFEEPIPESYKTCRKVIDAVLGRPLTDKPVL